MGRVQLGYGQLGHPEQLLMPSSGVSGLYNPDNDHPVKANVVIDALSRKSYCNNLVAKERLPELHEEFEKLRIEACDSGYLQTLRVTYTLEDRIKEAEKSCKEIQKIKNLMEGKKLQNYQINERGTVWLKDRLCVSQDNQI